MRYLLLSLAILLGLASLALAVGRIYATERALRDDLGENLVWTLAQNEVELLRFLDVLDAYGRGDPEADGAALQLRFDLLWSRWAGATQGPIAAQLTAVDGAHAALTRARATLHVLEGTLATLDHGDRAGAASIAETVRPLMPELHAAAVGAVHAEHAAERAVADLRRRELLNAVGLLGGTLLATALLVALLIVELRRSGALGRSARAAEAAARHGRALLQAVIDAVPALVNVKDTAGRYVLMNRFQGQAYGVDPDAAVGQFSRDFTGEDYGGESLATDLRVIESGRGTGFYERPFVGPDGRRRLWWTAKQPMLGADGAVRHVVTVAMDITDLKAAERAKANLARHFSPNMVDLLAERDEPLGQVRSQQAAVLFADLVDFTRFATCYPPEQVMATLRELLARLTEVVLSHGGTLEKFLGDGLMATFGTPQPQADDAGRALLAARAMADAIAAWNAEAAPGLGPLRIGIGAHLGPVLLGEVGSARRVEFAVVGETVNLASRLQDLTRRLDASAAVSRALAQAAARCPQGARALAGLRPVGAQRLDGIAEPVEVLVYDPPLPAAAALPA